MFGRSQSVVEEVWGDTRPGIHSVAEHPEAGNVDAAAQPPADLPADLFVRGIRALCQWRPIRFDAPAGLIQIGGKAFPWR